MLYTLQKGQNQRKILISGILPSILLFFLVLIFVITNYTEIVNTFLENEEFQGVMQHYKSFGVDVDEKFFREIITLFVKLDPSVELLVSVSGIILFYAGLVNIYSKEGHDIPQLPSIIHWKSPDWILWFLCIGIGLGFLLDNQSINIIGLNMLVLSGANYFLQGLGIFQSFFIQKDVSYFIRIIFYVFIFLQPIILLPIIISVGIIDIWKDFRKSNLQEDD